MKWEYHWLRDHLMHHGVGSIRDVEEIEDAQLALETETIWLEPGRVGLPRRDPRMGPIMIAVLFTLLGFIIGLVAGGILK